jgi:hypothetical protein
MNLNSLQTQIDYRRRDTTESFISWEEKLAYINEGLATAASNAEYEWTKTSTSFSYVDGDFIYQLSSVAPDYDEAISMFYSDDYHFEPVSPQHFYALSGQGVNIFSIDNERLLVHTSFGSGTIGLNYYSSYTAKTSAGYWLANLSASTDEPLMPETYQKCLVDYGGAMCHYKEGMYDDGDREMSRFEKMLKTMQAKTPSRKKHYSKRFLSNIVGGATQWSTKNDPLAQTL